MIAPVSMLASHRAWGGARLPPAGGFLDAVALRPQAWKPLIEDHRAGIPMAPLFLLNGDMKITDDATDENELLAEAGEMIATCIAGIHESWRDYQKPA